MTVRIPARGVTLLELLVVLSVIGLLTALLLPGVLNGRESQRRTQCASNLRQIGVALQGYQSTCGVLPFGVGADADKNDSSFTSPKSRRFSAQSQMLPHLEQANLFRKIDFRVQPFFPDETGDPAKVTGKGPNEEAAQVKIGIFVCPSDTNRLERPWGPNNYRACAGSTWSGRVSDGMFGQGTAIRAANVVDGMANTAAFSERVLGDDDRKNVDMQSDLFGLDSPWTEETLRDWCRNLTEAQAAKVPVQDSNGGMTWLEGNMNWTRYNHVLPPGHPSCKGKITWEGVAMTANSRHPGGVNLLFGDGGVRFVQESIDEKTWRALGTINGTAKGEVLDDAAW